MTNIYPTRWTPATLARHIHQHSVNISFMVDCDDLMVATIARLYKLRNRAIFHSEVNYSFGNREALPAFLQPLTEWRPDIPTFSGGIPTEGISQLPKEAVTYTEMVMTPDPSLPAFMVLPLQTDEDDVPVFDSWARFAHARQYPVLFAPNHRPRPTASDLYVVAPTDNLCKFVLPEPIDESALGVLVHREQGFLGNIFAQ